MSHPRIGSLFSGVGGLDLAVEQFFGGATAWHCQHEPPDKNGRPDEHQFAAQVLAAHWPGVPNLGDITQVNWDRVEPVDILTGGFPCTDVSLAGKRAGLNDQTRSGLWAHMARAIHALNPKLVVIENVRGLLSAPADTDGDMEPCPWCVGDGDGEPVLRALGAVLGDLAGLGFDAEWVGLPASGVGACHERFRVFIVAWPADTEGPRLEDRRLRGLAGADVDQVVADADQLGAHRPGARRAGRDEPADHRVATADADRGRRTGHGELPTGRDTVRVRVRVDAHRRHEAPADASRGGQLSAERHVQPGQPDADRCAPADPESVGRGEGRPEPARLGGGPDSAVGSAPDWGVYGPAIARWERVTGRPAPGPVDDRGRLAPVLVEWMMGYPDGWFTAVPAPGMSASQLRNAQLKAGGNGVVPQQALAALDHLWRRATHLTAAAAA